MATIKQIDLRTIHQIQSGQVIVDLCSVVKELVENSIDAEATSIDIRFKNQGLGLIEVQDNGTGISPANYPSVALKHHTSKLSSYADISSLQTFGFRGEALASLCALSALSVTTCQASEVPKGAKLSFEISGQLKGTSIVAAQRGTTVSVENLFHNLPVRRRELERNIKREWHKVIALLNQYACIKTNVKFSVSQQPTKGKRIHLFSTRGNPTTRENIINIFGAKTMVALVPLDLKLEMQPSTVNKGVLAGNKGASASKDVHIIGHVSRPAHGEGRQTPDRQMFFVNGRPCGLPQFAKVFNEVYKSFNSSQNPFILADIQLDTDMYDVNVSPDKRSILLHDQNDLLDTFRESLMALFDSHDYSVPTAQLLRHRSSEAPPAKASPAVLKRPSRPQASNDESESDSQCDNEGDSEVDSMIGKVPPGRARTLGRSRSLVKDDCGQNLISGWVERKTGRSNTDMRSQAPSSTKVLELGDEQNKMDGSERGAATSSQSSESDDDGKPMPVKDFNKGLTKFGPKNTRARAARQAVVPSSPLEEETVDDEPPIHAVQPLRLTQADPIIGDRSPKPTQLNVRQPVTVTIGDHTITGTTSSPEASETETHSPKLVRSSHMSSKPNSTFGNRLTQLFSAGQAKQNEIVSDRIVSDDEDEEKDDVAGDNKGSAEEEEEEVVEEEEEEVEEHPLSRLTRPRDVETTTPPDVDMITVQLKPRSTDVGGRSLSVEEPPSSALESIEDDSDRPVAQEEDAAPQNLEPHVESAALEQRGLALKSGVRKKDATFQTMQQVRIKEETLRRRFASWFGSVPSDSSNAENESGIADLGATDAEEKLSLTISKGDFGRMRVAGQFNLGFIIAVRPAKNRVEDDLEASDDDELFIIDQHATDEKYNFERLQATTVVQSQRLVHPKRLELTALEEEIVMENMEALEANGFKVQVDTSGDEPVGSRCQVVALPLSRETTFTLKDLEELISLLGDGSSESKHIPRPSKVRKMFAMRACRSSIMIGKPLTQGQMETLVRHMGELDKPWNCPHGRPTMRHLCKLQSWDSKRWKEDIQQKSRTTWSSFARGE